MKTRYLLLLWGLLLLLSGCWKLVDNDMAGPFQPIEISKTSFPNIYESIQAASGPTICTINHKKEKQNRMKHIEGKEKKLGYAYFVYPFPVCEEPDTERSVFQVPEEEAQAFEEWLQEKVQNMSDGTQIMTHLRE